MLDHVPDHPLALRTQDVEGVGAHVFKRSSLQCQVTYLGPFPCVMTSWWASATGASASAATRTFLRCTAAVGGSPLRKQSIPSECHDDAHAQPPSVATITALMVCTRFSA